MTTEKRIALVTGGSGGIGQAVCEALAGRGYDVAVHYRSGADAAAKVVERINNSGSKALAFQADLTNEDEVRSMYESIEDQLGNPSVVINNAGADGQRAHFWEIDLDDWWKTVEINLKGTFASAREAMRRMVAAKAGVIVNMSSVHEVIPWGGYSAYASAKAGMEMLTRTMALEAAEHNVRVVGLAPGAIKTPINKDVWTDEDSLKDLHSKIPMKRMGTPEEIGKAVAFLVSDDAGYVTGSTLTVDGGMELYADFIQGG